MKKNTFSRRVMKLLFSSILIISLLSPNLVAFAADDFPAELTAVKEAALAKLPEDSMALCKQGLVTVYDIEILEFTKWIEGHFNSKSSTSSLVNTAISKYAEFKQKLNTTFAAVSPKYSADQGIQTYDDQYSSYTLCASITESYLELAKKQLKKHIEGSVAKKKTTMLLEKYEKINEKLRDLNIKVAELYSLFATFSSKLPFFTKNCQ
jgi:hypothetical protein